MKKSEIKKIIALVFIEGFEQFPNVKTKTELAIKIVNQHVFEKFTLHQRTLLNYYNHFFFNYNVSVNPSEDVIDVLLSFINYESQKQFIENQPSNLDYLDNVPLFLDLEDKDDHQKEALELPTSNKDNYFSNVISISDIESNQHTTISIKKETKANFKIDVKKIKSGKDTDINI